MKRHINASKFDTEDYKSMKRVLSNAIDTMLWSGFEDNLAEKVMQKCSDYDAEWCDPRGVLADAKGARARETYAAALAEMLLANYDGASSVQSSTSIKCSTNGEISYDLVSMAAIIRDFDEPNYKNDVHRQLTDIADSIYNVGIGPEEMQEMYKNLYYQYGEEYWDMVLKDMRAIDSQLDGHGDFNYHLRKEEELLADYNDRIGITATTDSITCATTTRYREFDAIVDSHGNPITVKYDSRTGIARVHAPDGYWHSCFANIDSTGSVRGMKQRGYWGKSDECVRSGSYIYNIDNVVVDDEYDYLALVLSDCLDADKQKKLLDYYGKQYGDIRYGDANTEDVDASTKVTASAWVAPNGKKYGKQTRRFPGKYLFTRRELKSMVDEGVANELDVDINSLNYDIVGISWNGTNGHRSGILIKDRDSGELFVGNTYDANVARLS